MKRPNLTLAAVIAAALLAGAPAAAQRRRPARPKELTPAERRVIERVTGTDINTLERWRRAAARDEDASLLKGVRRVSVRVEMFGAADDARADGLSDGALTAYVEMRMREAGIAVAPAGPDVPKFTVTFNLLKVKNGGVYTISMAVHLVERARMLRNPTSPFYADTWGLTQLFIRRENDLRSVRDNVQSAVDIFVNEYLAANPR